MTLGSLFDGIGGFPLAGTRCGLTPLWASEIEPGPISITRRHFPEMEHLGDITQIDGAAIRPVDVVTFGSPCQDLSVAGKRAGLEGEKSGLFMEAARIIKEMREATHGIHPRFAVWENVPGAFFNNKGEDFRAVIETIANIAEPGCTISRPSRGRWNPAGAVMGDDWSIAWRVLDAQYWGVPQRRRRIFLVADFASERAGEILFKREGLRGDPAQGGAAREGVADGVARGTGGADIYGETGIGYWQTGAQTIRAEGENRQSRPGHVVVQTISTLTASGTGTRYPARGVEDADKLVLAHPATTGTLCASGAGLNRTAGMASETDLCVVVDYPEGAAHDVTTSTFVSGLDLRNNRENGETSGTLQAHAHGGYSLNCTHPVRVGATVRRLTPPECERLQGLPDGWTEYGHDGKTISDSARYRAVGNGLAEPCARYILEGIAEAIQREERERTQP